MPGRLVVEMSRNWFSQQELTSIEVAKNDQVQGQDVSRAPYFFDENKASRKVETGDRNAMLIPFVDMLLANGS